VAVNRLILFCELKSLRNAARGYFRRSVAIQKIQSLSCVNFDGTSGFLNRKRAAFSFDF
jgi:hypothetical protein